jgi:hypothetical protein
MRAILNGHLQMRAILNGHLQMGEILNGNVILFLFWIMTSPHNLHTGRNIQGTSAMDKQLAL